jgi:hypothetical protein
MAPARDRLPVARAPSPSMLISSPSRVYDLVVRQEPKQARMCGVGGKGTVPPLCLCSRLTCPVKPTAGPSTRPPSSSSASSIPRPPHPPRRPRRRPPTTPATSPALPQMPPPTPSPTSRTPTTSCLPRWPSPTTISSSTGSRTAARDAPPAPSFRVSTTSRIHNTTIRVCRVSGLCSRFAHWFPDAGFFVFPDLSVRTEGSYRLKLSLFEVVGYVLFS